MPQVRRHLGRAALVPALLALAGGCSPVNSLEGSLTEVLDLSFTAVEVSITDSAVIIDYYRPNAESRDIVFKLVAQVKPTDVVPGKSIDLGPADDGTARASCTRSVANDPIRNLATIKSGELTLSAVPTLDQPVHGDFRVTLGEGGDAGKGRTAFGNFRVSKVVPGS